MDMGGCPQRAGDHEDSWPMYLRKGLLHKRADELISARHRISDVQAWPAKSTPKKGTKLTRLFSTVHI